MPEKDLTVEWVRERLAYDRDTGTLTWRDRPGDDHQTKAWRTKYAGKVAGSAIRSGYIEIAFSLGGGRRVRTYAHRVAWLIATGAWPAACIDHIDGDRTNNRLSNLRQATLAQNAWNTGARSWSKSGIKGVSWESSRQKWFASIVVNRKQIALGRFDTKEQASAAYAEAARKYHGDFANTGNSDA